MIVIIILIFMRNRIWYWANGLLTFLNTCMVLDSRRRNGKGRNFSFYTNRLRIHHSRHLNIRKWSSLTPQLCVHLGPIDLCPCANLSENELQRLLALVSPLGILLPSGYFIYLCILGLRTLESQKLVLIHCSLYFFFFFVIMDISLL